MGDYDAASIWIPPGGVELTEDEEGQVESILRNLVGARADEIIELLLSLLGTHPDRRGEGLGMGLLAENLARIDSEGMPAYLESSNSANDHRYERLGFERVGHFTRPDEEVGVSTMWRPARPVPG